MENRENEKAARDLLKSLKYYDQDGRNNCEDLCDVKRVAKVLQSKAEQAEKEFDALKKRYPWNWNIKLESEVAELQKQLDAVATEEWDKLKDQNARLREALGKAYTHNQNMHCYATGGKLNLELNLQTVELRKAISQLSNQGDGK